MLTDTMEVLYLLAVLQIQHDSKDIKTIPENVKLELLRKDVSRSNRPILTHFRWS